MITQLCFGSMRGLRTFGVLGDCLGVSRERGKFCSSASMPGRTTLDVFVVGVSLAVPMMRDGTAQQLR